jgi:hypothetical protein
MLETKGHIVLTLCFYRALAISLTFTWEVCDCNTVKLVGAQMAGG